MSPLIPQLLLVKYLFQRGEDVLAEKGPYSAGLAVSLFQDAIELMAWTIAKEVDAKVSVQPGFAAMWDAIKAAPKNTGNKELPLKAKMLDVNNARVGFKHYGNMPVFDDAARFQVYTEQFLTISCSEFLGVDFSTVSLIDLIESDYAAQHLRLAEQALQANDAKGALEECAKADHFLSKPLRELVPAIGHEFSSAVGKIKEPHALLLRAGVYTLEESVIALRNLSLITSLRIPLVDHLRYRAAVPGVQESLSGVLTIVWHPRPIASADAEFCINYLVDFALALQGMLSGLSANERAYLFGSKTPGT